MICKAFKDFLLKDLKKGKREGISKGLLVAQLYDCLLLGIQTAQAFVIQGSIINCPDTAELIGHGLEKQSLGNICNCYYGYCRRILFATCKFFERFCNETPKDKYCHEFTTGDFSQSSLKKVIFLMPQE